MVPKTIERESKVLWSRGPTGNKQLSSPRLYGACSCRIGSVFEVGAAQAATTDSGGQERLLAGSGLLGSGASPTEPNGPKNVRPRQKHRIQATERHTITPLMASSFRSGSQQVPGGVNAPAAVRFCWPGVLCKHTQTYKT